MGVDQKDMLPAYRDLLEDPNAMRRLVEPPWPDGQSPIASWTSLNTPVVSARALALLLVVTVLGSGCRSDKPEAIDWDLSRSHTMADVGWPRPDLELTEISPVDSVRIRLPVGKVFSAGKEIHDVTLEREGETVTYVQIDSDPRSTEDVYRLAVDWAEKWDLPREPLERWHRERLAGRTSGTENVRSTVMTTQPGSRPAGDVPAATLEIRYSFNDELPSLVSLQFYWGRKDLRGG